MARLIHVCTSSRFIRHIEGLLCALVQHGHEVHVVSSAGPELDELGRWGISTHELAMTRSMSPAADAWALGRMTALFSRLEPDLVHGHNPKGGLLSMSASSLSGVRRRVYHLHGLPLSTSRGWRRSVLRGAERLSCSLAHRTLCVSPSLRDEVVRAGVVRASSVDVLARGSAAGVDAEARFVPDPQRARGQGLRRALGIPPEAVVFGFVARYLREKGVFELDRAWQQVRESLPHSHLLLAGGADEVEAIDLTRLRADPRVHDLGFVEDTPTLYEALDLVVLPTYREGLPVVLLEAAAMGLSVVATTVTGCVDAVVHGQTGLLVPPRDSLALAEAMLKMGRDAALRASFGAAARARVVVDYRQEDILAALVELYAGLGVY